MIEVLLPPFGKNVVFNLNFDDLHPEGSNSISDCGGDKDKGVLKYVLRLIKDFPDLKATFFTSANWIDKDNKAFTFILKRLSIDYTRRWDDEPFRLDKHKEWCRWIDSIKNLEIATHGYYHHQNRNPHSAEFENMIYEEAKNRLKLMLQVFNKSKINYVKGFRPPGWGINKATIKALKKLSFDFVSMSSDVNSKITQKAKCKEAGLKEVSMVRPELINGLINIPQNMDISKSNYSRAKQIADINGLISLKGHVEEYYGKDRTFNGLTGESYNNAKNIISELKENYDVWFAGMKDIAERFFLVKNVNISNGKLINNNKVQVRHVAVNLKGKVKRYDLKPLEKVRL